MRTRRVLLMTAAVVLVVVAGGLGLRALWRTAVSQFATTGCTLGTFSLDTSQAAVASTMVGVVTTRALPERAAVLALAAGLQESKLRNLPPGAGDRDSVGVLQQRPSQGWGTPAQLNDVHYATNAFLNALLRVPHWQSLPLAQAVQDVQVSADGSAYAQHETEAQAVADRLMGKPPAGITCTFDKPTVVSSTTVIAAQLQRDLPVNPPSVAPRTVTVPGAGWQTAAWFVANADRLGIDTVGFDGKSWSRAKGWQTASTPRTAVAATLAG